MGSRVASVEGDDDNDERDGDHGARDWKCLTNTKLHAHESSVFESNSLPGNKNLPFVAHCPTHPPDLPRLFKGPCPPMVPIMYLNDKLGCFHCFCVPLLFALALQIFQYKMQMQRHDAHPHEYEFHQIGAKNVSVTINFVFGRTKSASPNGARLGEQRSPLHHAIQPKQKRKNV